MGELRNQLGEAQKQIYELEDTVTAQVRTVEDFSACIEKIKIMLHNHIFDQQQATIGECPEC